MTWQFFAGTALGAFLSWFFTALYAEAQANRRAIKALESVLSVLPGGRSPRAR